ncbi:MAG: hypothetical protein JXL81_12125 [Deltaproteobacteria bacterium]|nr:hypothetical protein [Deltaproteobacteria bacterium]
MSIIKKGDLAPVYVTYGDMITKEGSSFILPDETLEGFFESYWSYRLNGLAEKAFLLEVPYFQECVRFTIYENFINSHVGLSGKGAFRIEINDVNVLNENLISFQIGVFGKVNKSEHLRFYAEDRWVKVRGKWFHILIDPIFFPKLD